MFKTVNLHAQKRCQEHLHSILIMHIKLHCSLSLTVKVFLTTIFLTQTNQITNHMATSFFFLPSYMYNAFFFHDIFTHIIWHIQGNHWTKPSYTAICHLKSSSHITIYLQDIQTLDQLEHCSALSIKLWNVALEAVLPIQMSVGPFYMCKPKTILNKHRVIYAVKKLIFSSCWIA